MQADTVESMTEQYRSKLEDGESVALEMVHEPHSELFVDWTPYIGSSLDAPADTSFDNAVFQELSAHGSCSRWLRAASSGDEDS